MRKTSKLLAILFLTLMLSLTFAACAATQYTVTFDTGTNASTVAPVKVTKGQTVTRPATDPTRTDYTFENWYQSEAADAAVFNFGTKIEKDTTIYAKWLKNHAITYHLNGGTLANKPDYVPEGRTLTITGTPTKENFGFAGWYSNEALTTEFNFATPITAPTQIWAKFLPMHALSYELYGGTFTGQRVESIMQGQTLTQPEAPTREGYTFGGWYSESGYENEFAFSQAIQGPATLHAMWRQNLTVTWHLDGGTLADKPAYVAQGLKLTKPADPVKADAVFDGWFKNEELTEAFNFNQVINEGPVNIYAKWLEEVVLTYNVGAGAQSMSPQSVGKGTKPQRPAEPIKEGYVFAGWYGEQAYTTKFNFDEPMQNNATVYARWHGRYDAFNTAMDSILDQGSFTATFTMSGLGEMSNDIVIKCVVDDASDDLKVLIVSETDGIERERLITGNYIYTTRNPGQGDEYKYVNQIHAYGQNGFDTKQLYEELDAFRSMVKTERENVYNLDSFTTRHRGSNIEFSREFDLRPAYQAVTNAISSIGDTDTVWDTVASLINGISDAYTSTNNNAATNYGARTFANNNSTNAANTNNLNTRANNAGRASNRNTAVNNNDMGANNSNATANIDTRTDNRGVSLNTDSRMNNRNTVNNGIRMNNNTTFNNGMLNRNNANNTAVTTRNANSYNNNNNNNGINNYRNDSTNNVTGSVGNNMVNNYRNNTVGNIGNNNRNTGINNSGNTSIKNYSNTAINRLGESGITGQDVRDFFESLENKTLVEALEELSGKTSSTATFLLAGAVKLVGISPEYLYMPVSSITGEFFQGVSYTELLGMLDTVNLSDLLGQALGDDIDLSDIPVPEELKVIVTFVIDDDSLNLERIKVKINADLGQEGEIEATPEPASMSNRTGLNNNNSRVINRTTGFMNNGMAANNATGFANNTATNRTTDFADNGTATNQGTRGINREAAMHQGDWRGIADDGTSARSAANHARYSGASYAIGDRPVINPQTPTVNTATARADRGTANGVNRAARFNRAGNTSTDMDVNNRTRNRRDSNNAVQNFTGVANTGKRGAYSNRTFNNNADTMMYAKVEFSDLDSTTISYDTTATHEIKRLTFVIDNTNEAYSQEYKTFGNTLDYGEANVIIGGQDTAEPEDNGSEELSGLRNFSLTSGIRGALTGRTARNNNNGMNNMSANNANMNSAAATSDTAARSRTAGWAYNSRAMRNLSTRTRGNMNTRNMPTSVNNSANDNRDSMDAVTSVNNTVNNNRNGVNMTAGANDMLDSSRLPARMPARVDNTGTAMNAVNMNSDRANTFGRSMNTGRQSQSYLGDAQRFDEPAEEDVSDYLKPRVIFDDNTVTISAETLEYIYLRDVRKFTVRVPVTGTEEHVDFCFVITADTLAVEEYGMPRQTRTATTGRTSAQGLSNNQASANQSAVNNNQTGLNNNQTGLTNQSNIDNNQTGLNNNNQTRGVNHRITDGGNTRVSA